MRSTIQVCTALAAFAALSAAADVVHFINGDRLSGTLVDAEPNTVAIDVPHIGVIVAPESQVARVAHAAGVAGQPSAHEALAPSKAEAAASPATPQTPPPTPEPSDVPSDPPIAATAKRFSEWDLRSQFGLAVVSGNTRTQDVDFVVNAERTGQRFDNVFGISVHKARARAGAQAPIADTKDQFDINYDLRWKYRDTWYAVANFEFFRDPIKDINRRVTAGVGLGNRFWASTRGALDTDVGVSRVFEQLDVGGVVDESQDPALRWSVNFKRWLLEDRLEMFHNSQWLYILASGRGSVWDSDTGLRLQLANRWQAGVRFDLQHESHPAAARGKTDFGYALTLGVAL